MPRAAVAISRALSTPASTTVPARTARVLTAAPRDDTKDEPVWSCSVIAARAGSAWSAMRPPSRPTARKSCAGLRLSDHTGPRTRNRRWSSNLWHRSAPSHASGNTADAHGFYNVHGVETRNGTIHGAHKEQRAQLRAPSMQTRDTLSLGDGDSPHETPGDCVQVQVTTSLGLAQEHRHMLQGVARQGARADSSTVPHNTRPRLRSP